MTTKKRYFHKPTYKAVRTSLLALKGHAETNNVTRISMPRIGCGLDQLDWQKFKDMIQDVFHGSTVQVALLTLPAAPEQHDAKDGLTPETPASVERTHFDEFSSALQIAQQNDKALNLFYQWLTGRNSPSTRELQGCPRVAWQLANQLKSLEIKDGILCQRFELPKTGDHFLQQIIPQKIIHELLPSIHSSPTCGHLGVFKTTENLRQCFYWPNFKDDIKIFISSCENCQKRVNPSKTHKHSLSEWPPVTPFFKLESTLWVSSHSLTVISTYCYLATISRNIMELYRSPSKQRPPQSMHCSNIGFAVSDVHIASTATKAGTSSQRFSNCSCNPLKLKKHVPLLLDLSLMQSSSG